MFHQAADIKIVLSPFVLRESSVAEKRAMAGPIASTTLLHLVKADLDARAHDRRLTYDFVKNSGLCGKLDQGLSVLEQKLSVDTEVRALNLDAVYNIGMTSFDSGQIEDAIFAFAVAASHQEFRIPSLSALAACACFREEYDVALMFAQESIIFKKTHPRTYLIAGYSALKSGDKKTAKRYLALATRLARGDAQYRDEQRCAQRELLLMQLAS